MSYTKHDRIVSGAEIYASDIKDMDNKIYDHDSDISDLQDSVDVLEPMASAGDVGKALKVKTVAGGKVTEYEFGETAIIDSTLTEAGKAADAKKTGDEITDLKSALNTFEEENKLLVGGTVGYGHNISFEDGGINASTGANYNGTGTYKTWHKRSGYFSLSAGFTYVFNVSSGYTLYVFIYDANKVWTEIMLSTTTFVKYTPESNCLCRIAIASASDSYPFDAEDAYNYCHVSYDKTLLTGNDLANVIDASSLFADFPLMTAVNATYYSGRVRNYGTATTRLINQTTLYYSVPVKIKATKGYTFNAFHLTQPYTFTQDTAAASTGGSGEMVSEYTLPAYTYGLLVVKNDSNTDIAPSEWATALTIEMYPNDLMTLTQKNETLYTTLYPFDANYMIRGKAIDLDKHGLNVTLLSATPQEATERTVQGIAIWNGTIVQGYSDGSIDFIDLSAGTVNASLNIAGGHCGSLSFSDVFQTDSDDFPILYVSSFSENKTFKYHIDTTSFELLATYLLPEEAAGYYQESAYNRYDGTLWVIGHKTNSSSLSTALVYSHWNLTNTTDNGDGTVTPTLIEAFDMPFMKYLQFIQILNNQMFIGFGSTNDSTPEDYTQIWVMDTTDKKYKAVMNEFGSTIRAAELEGCDFIFNNVSKKYDMILATRKSPKYYRIEIQ